MNKTGKPYDWKKDKAARRDLEKSKRSKAKDVLVRADVVRGHVFNR